MSTLTGAGAREDKVVRASNIVARVSAHERTLVLYARIKGPAIATAAPITIAS